MYTSKQTQPSSRQTKRACPNTNISDSDEHDQLPQCDRWFIIEDVDQDRPISKLSPFAVKKGIKCAVGTVNTIRVLRKSDILVEISSATQNQLVNKMNNLADRPVTVSPHRTLNTCKGVIRCCQQTDCHKQEIIQELSSLISHSARK